MKKSKKNLAVVKLELVFEFGECWTVIYPSGHVVFCWEEGKEKAEELAELYNKTGQMA